MRPEEIRDAFSYDASTGILRWRTGRLSGRIAGTIREDGYVIIKFMRRKFYGHRIAWLVYYGDWPSLDIDHINGNRSDNRISNIREVSVAQNHWNSKKYKNNTTGFRGVYLHNSGKWCAEIWWHGHKKYLGLFATKEEASTAHEKARGNLYGKYSRAA